jgi:hypothetical protein
VEGSFRLLTNVPPRLRDPDTRTYLGTPCDFAWKVGARTLCTVASRSSAVLRGQTVITSDYLLENWMGRSMSRTEIYRQRCWEGQAVLLPQLGFLHTSILFRGRHRDIL